MVGGDFRFKETLLLFAPARHVRAQRLDDVNGLFKRRSRLGGIIEGAVCIARREAAFPEGLDVADLPGQSCCACGRVEFLRVVALRLVNLGDVVERVGDSGFVSHSFPKLQALPVIRHGLREIALRLVNAPDAVERNGNSVSVFQ